MPPQSPEVPGTPDVSNLDLNEQLGNRQNLKTLGDALAKIAERLGKDAPAHDVLAALKATSMEVHPDSAARAVMGARTTLESFIKSLGLPLPSSHFSASGLSDAVLGRAQIHPLGNLEGALGWPVPMSADDQQRLHNLALNYATAPDQPTVKQTPGSLLAYLREQTTLAPDVLGDPVKTLNALISSPAAQLLGKSLQEGMQHVATDSSAMDHLLAAMTLQLDPESITEANRNLIAGFDLAHEDHWNQTADKVVQALGKHLVANGKTSPDLAGVAAYLLLASRAPVFLIKDIPSTVTYGSPAWVNLAVAATTIEARTPGRVASMTFAEVMLEAESASLADRSVTQDAQREALIDWGVVQGVLVKKADHLYSAEELAALLSEFKARTALMTSANQVFEKELPSRALKADTVLKERFPGMEALYDERLIHVSIQGRRPWGDIYHRPGPVGPHSLRDIVMMDLKGPLRYSTTDSRIPIDTLNATPTFGVRESFDQEFETIIEEKKGAMNTAIRHLIAQLPLEDRQNFELGKISFFYNQSTSLSTEIVPIWGNTRYPKEEPLLLRVERDGKATDYEISFKNGSIRSFSASRAELKTTMHGNVRRETKAFKPSKGAEALAKQQPPTDKAVPDSFNSARSQLIADAFVEHTNFDDEAILDQARGFTYEDRNYRRSKVVEGFLLNLVPFYSAINNFRQGNIGSGLLDLGLDVFGFLTAGVATAGKVIKIAGTAASAASKSARAAKVIGMATFSALNPVGGLGDAAVGGARLAGKGLRFLENKATKAVNAMRGATGSYDVLTAAGKGHGAAVMGTYPSGNVKLSAIAVFKNNRWYHYDPIKKNVFGAPIKNFSRVGASSMIVRGAGSNNAAFRHLLNAAQSPTNAAAYQRGLTQGSPFDLPGFHVHMSSDDLVRIALNNHLTPEQMGTLVREIKALRIEEAKLVVSNLKHDVRAPDVTFIDVSQIDYLARTDITSTGHCAGLSNLMALAVMLGKEDELIKNIKRAAMNPGDAKAAEFIQELHNFQLLLGDRYAAHMGNAFKQQNHLEIIDELTNSPTSKTIRIVTEDHVMVAGIKVEGSHTSWFFYDPDGALVKFTTLQSMQEGMEKVLNSGRHGKNINPYVTDKGEKFFETSEFVASDMDRVSGAYKELLDTVL
ncbi:hypothetical protein QQ999_08970 [Pseudomonas fluorescens]